MSVYFIASDKQKVSQAGNDLKELYGKSADICSWGQIHMAISAAYRENYIMHSYDGGFCAFLCIFLPTCPLCSFAFLTVIKNLYLLSKMKINVSLDIMLQYVLIRVSNVWK